MAFNPNTIWISHTSLNDFEKCQQLYYLRNLYRDKKFGNNFRIQVASPYLSLGEAVHDAIDNFITRYQGDQRTKDNLMYEFKRGWALKPGKIGGFKNKGQEEEFKARGEAMLERFYKNERYSKGTPLRIDFPKLPLIGEDDAILVGNFDWLEETPEGLHILDFKTGKEEDENSQQLPIYALLAEHNFKKPVTKVSYWYLDRDDEPVEKNITDLTETLNRVKEKTDKVAAAISVKAFPCQSGEEKCKYCYEYHSALNESAEHVQTDFKRKREIFFLPN
ncbi:MAG TPA: PD-(D/E)XK nuclease family protein [Candidatus Saccharimonadales bacterium]|nr:PD-(D/E)XK nuclease family protein [Candidatus Saccharimonadales bacterium]